MVARALLIDLDDTLYDEASYVRSGFAIVAREIAGLRGAGSVAQVEAVMRDELARCGRGKVFDATLQRLGIAPRPDLIKGLVEVYRDHHPDIVLWPGVREALVDLSRDHLLAIVTDGLGVMQRRKVTALGLESLVETLVYCWDLGWPKPDPRSYLKAMETLVTNPEPTLFSTVQLPLAQQQQHPVQGAALLTGTFTRMTSRLLDPEAAPFSRPLATRTSRHRDSSGANTPP